MNLLERALHTYTLSECIDPFDIRSVPIMTDLTTNIKPGIFYKYLITYPYITYINILPRNSSYHKILHILWGQQPSKMYCNLYISVDDISDFQSTSLF